MKATDLVLPVLGGVRVLVVEDGEDAAASLTAVLRLNGFDAHSARTGAEALEAVKDSPPKVVLLDLDLSDIDGCELIRRIRARPDAPAVVVVTGHTALAWKKAAVAAGAVAYRLKPADPIELVKLVQQLSHPTGE